MKTKIPIKKFDPAGIEDFSILYALLTTHHLEETAFLIKRIEELEEAEAHASENVDSIIRSVAENEYGKGYADGYECGYAAAQDRHGG